MFQWEKTSRKFRVMVFDAVISLILLCVGIWVKDPDMQKFIIAVIGILQAPCLAVIAGTAYEDGKEKGAATHTHYHYNDAGYLEDGNADGFLDEDNLPIGGEEIPSPDPQPQG